MEISQATLFMTPLSNLIHPNVIQIPVLSWRKLCSGYKPSRNRRRFCGFMGLQELENRLYLTRLQKCGLNWASSSPAFYFSRAYQPQQLETFNERWSLAQDRSDPRSCKKAMAVEAMRALPEMKALQSRHGSEEGNES